MREREPEAIVQRPRRSMGGAVDASDYTFRNKADENENLIEAKVNQTYLQIVREDKDKAKRRNKNKAAKKARKR